MHLCFYQTEGLFGKCTDRIRLPVTNLDQCIALPNEVPGKRPKDDAKVSKAVWASRKCPPRLMMADLRLQGGKLVLGDVGRIRGHQVEPSAHRIQPVGASHLHPLTKTQSASVLPRAGQRACCNVGGQHGDIGTSTGEYTGNGPASGAEIKRSGPCGQEAEYANCPFGQFLGLRSGYKHAGANLDIDVKKTHRPGEVGQRNAATTGVDQTSKTPGMRLLRFLRGRRYPDRFATSRFPQQPRLPWGSLDPARQ